MKNVAIILGGGGGVRFGESTPKQFIILHGRRVIDYSIQTFHEHTKIDKIIIVCHSNWIDVMKKEYPNHDVVNGGESRKDSSYNGLLACPKDTQNVFIHDSARPFIDKDIISRCFSGLEKNKAVSTVLGSTDTIVEVENNYIIDIPTRDRMFLVQTPQAFNYKTILNAHESFTGETTDDIRLVKKLGVNCYVIEGSVYNFKLTHPSDIYLAEIIAQSENQKRPDLKTINDSL